MSSNYHIVEDFVLEQAALQPIARRVKLYRSLAQLVGENKEGHALLDLATDLESADRRCREFAFQFSQRKEGV